MQAPGPRFVVPSVMLSWDDLRFVLALSRDGSATAAGRSIGVNATTVARRIQAIEEQLGVRLFDRRSSGTVPTDAGEAAIQTALRIEEEVLSLDAEIRGLDAELRGNLRVTSTDMFFDLWRHDLIEFQCRYPNVELSLATNNLPVDLARREADIAIRLSTAPPDYLVGRRLCEVFFAVYGARKLVDGLTESGRSPIAYAGYPWIGWDEPMAGPTDRVIQRVAEGARVSVRINTMELLIRSVSDGMGISVMPCFVGDGLPDVVRIGPYFEGDTYLWVLTHASMRNTARVRAFITAVAQAAARDEARLQGQAPAQAATAVCHDTR